MPAAQGPDLTRLDELYRRFDRAACDYPNVDGVVVYRPDLRRQEAERQGRLLHAKTENRGSADFPGEVVGYTNAEHATLTSAREWESWIPPGFKSIEQVGGQLYWARVMRASECPESGVPPTCMQLWYSALFGPPAREFENAAIRIFSLVVTDSARLILPSVQADGTALLSRWLIHLADRPEPIVPDARRRYLAWPMLGGTLGSPYWVPVTPQNPPTSWWAARLPNIFRLSRIAIEQAIANAPATAVHQRTTKKPSPIQPAKAAGDPESRVMRYLQQHPATTNLDLPSMATETGLSLRRIQRMQPWKDHEEAYVQSFLQEHPNATAQDVEERYGISAPKVVDMKAWASHHAKKVAARPPRQVEERPLPSEFLKSQKDNKESGIDRVEQRDVLFHRLIEAAGETGNSDLKGKLNRLGRSDREQLIDFLLDPEVADDLQEKPEGEKNQLLVAIVLQWFGQHEQNQRQERSRAKG